MVHLSDDGRAMGFRQLFWRGLGIVLPTILTIWIIIAAYGFVQQNIAQPINRGVRQLILRATPWPHVSEDEIQSQQAATRAKLMEEQGLAFASMDQIRFSIRQDKLTAWWSRSLLLDLIGLVIAVGLIYVAGALVGRQLHGKAEKLLQKLPLFRQVYPSVKQVTEFLVGSDDETLKFNRVVAVQYPRMGIWAIGLVTGATLAAIQDAAGRECLTVFVPSSPTPFTGWVITVPKDDTIDLPMTIEEAVRFLVSGGVIVSPSLRIGSEALPVGALTPPSQGRPNSPAQAPEPLAQGPQAPETSTPTPL